MRTAGSQVLFRWLCLYLLPPANHRITVTIMHAPGHLVRKGPQVSDEGLGFQHVDLRRACRVAAQKEVVKSVAPDETRILPYAS